MASVSVAAGHDLADHHLEELERGPPHPNPSHERRSRPLRRIENNARTAPGAVYRRYLSAAQPWAEHSQPPIDGLSRYR
jgi:hypothetical protein